MYLRALFLFGFVLFTIWMNHLKLFIQTEAVAQMCSVKKVFWEIS